MSFITPERQSVVLPGDGPTGIALTGGGSTLVVTKGPNAVAVPARRVPQVVVTMAIPGPPGKRGPPGPSGDTAPIQVGPVALSGHSAVAVDPSGLLIPADCTLGAHMGAVVGIVDQAWSPGDDAEVQNAFVLSHAGWAWTPGPVFVGADGRLVQTLPLDAIFSQVVGHAVSATNVLIDLQPPVSLT